MASNKIGVSDGKLPTFKVCVPIFNGLSKPSNKVLKVLSTLETLSTDIGLLFSSNSILPVNPVEGFGSNTLLSNLTINSFLEIASKLVAFAGVFVT